MRLNSLAKLYYSMKEQGLDLQHFPLRLNQLVTCDCLFSIREVPFVLSLTSIGKDPKFVKFEIERGFQPPQYLDGTTYRNLISMLKTDGSSKVSLVLKEFFGELDSKIPGIAYPNKVPSPREIIRMRHDITEERGKVYFYGWIRWSKESKKSPSYKNLIKTLLLLGPDAYRLSKEYNMSSSWTAEPRDKCWQEELKKLPNQSGYSNQ